MKKSTITKLPAFFDRYIHLVEDMDIIEALQTYRPTAVLSDLESLLALEDRVYLPGKWTVKSILQHMIDTERIMTYRALRFARKDTTILPGFDEEWYGKHAEADFRTVEDLIAEFAFVRESTIALFQSFNEDMLKQKGETFVGTITVLSLGFVIVGHLLHHRRVLDERYLPLLDSTL
ncbi:MAG: DinB family protein [Spirosomataceae bacterium]